MSANDFNNNYDQVSEKKSNVTFDFAHLLINDTLPFKNNELTETEILQKGKENLKIFFEELFKLNLTQSGDQEQFRDFSKSESTVKLPKAVLILPRSKPLPKKAILTKWEKFRLEKGIQAKSKRGRFIYSEDFKEWMPRYGKGR